MPSKNVASWTRDELEDTYIRTYDENTQLRKKICEKDNTIKKFV